MRGLKRIVPVGSIFPKLVLTFVAVVLPLFSLSLALNELAKKEVRTQISDAMKARLHYEVLGLEQELERILNSQQKAINDGDLLDLVGQVNIMTNYRKTETINRVSQKLTDLKDSSGLIAKAGVYLPGLGRVFTTWGVESGDEAIKEVEAITEASYSGGYPITEWDNRLFLTLSVPGKADFRREPPSFVHWVELSDSALKTRMSRISEGGGSILYGERWSLVGDDEASRAEEIRSSWAASEGETDAMFTLTAGGTKYLVFYEKSALLESTMAVYIPEDVVLGKLKSYRLWFWLLVGCSMVILVVFCYGLYQLIQRPLSLLVRQFRNVEEGNFNVSVKLDRKDEFGYLFVRFGRTVNRLKQLIDELYVQKIRSQQSELKQLQSQITPHFLYNSFFILNQLIKSYDIEKAEKVSRNLGAYFQYITRNGAEEVPLESEVEHVRSYMEIQNIRFSNRIEVSMDELPEAFRKLSVPRLILQPIIENAYQHGLGDVMGDGSLRIRYRGGDGLLRIEVSDNGKGLSAREVDEWQNRLRAASDEGESTGMVNVHRRLRLKYGTRGGLELRPAEPRGLIVILSIPTERSR